MYLTSLVINKGAQGVFLPLDEKNLSLKEIFEGIEKAYCLKRINIPLIQSFLVTYKIKTKYNGRLLRKSTV